MAAAKRQALSVLYRVHGVAAAERCDGVSFSVMQADVLVNRFAVGRRRRNTESPFPWWTALPAEITSMRPPGADQTWLGSWPLHKDCGPQSACFNSIRVKLAMLLMTAGMCLCCRGIQRLNALASSSQPPQTMIDRDKVLLSRGPRLLAHVQ
jgi:hypothetical protein